MLRGIVAFLTLLLFPVLAQSPTGNIVGRVTDQSGAVVPGAKVVARHIETRELREVVTDRQGDYTIPNLAPGQYTLVIEKDGFHRMDQRGLTLEIEQTARLDVQLQVGAVSDVIEVHASVPLLNTETPVKGDVIVSKEMVDIPLDGRDFADLAYLVPGVSQKQQGGDGSNFAVNGARTDNTNFVVDGFADQNPRGGAAQVRPPIDSMMEFKMQTTGYSAEYGRLAGGSMNMVLKSGTNRVHGGIFEFFRNDYLDARSYFAIEKTKLRRNQFGAMADGPVYIPKLYNGHDRTFFLFNYEGYRQLGGDFKRAVTPTPLMKEGIFNSNIADPWATGSKCGSKNGACFPDRTIPKDRWDPIAVQVARYYPQENVPGEKNNFYTVQNDPDKWDSFVAKIDHRIGVSDTFAVRMLKRLNSSTAPYDGGPAGLFGTNTYNHQSLFGLNYNRIFRATLINEVRVGFTRTHDYEPGFTNGTDYASQWGLQGSTTDPKLIGFPRFTVNGIMALGQSADTPVMFTVNNYEWADTLTWVKAKHMLKFGFNALRTQFFQPRNNNNRGTFNFNNGWTSVGYADLLLGALNQTTRTVGANPNYLFFTTYGAFAQDDYKATPTLTLSLGLRYELPKPPIEKYGRLTNFVPEFGKIVLASDKTIPDLAQLLAAAGLTGKVVLAKDVGYPPSMIFTAYKCFAPRFGFAWRPRSGTRTVVRGGYGIYYGNNLWNPVRNDLGNVYPFSIAETHNKNANNIGLLTLQNPWGTSGSLDGVLTPNGFQARPTPQYLQSWNLTIERELGRGVGLEAGYIGSKGTHLGRKYNVNMPFRALDTKLPGGGFPRPIAGFNDIDYYSFGSNSIYSAGMITIRRRISRGIFFHANYVYSKSIDNQSQISGNSDGGIANTLDARNLRLERGRSDWDRGHSFTSLFMYNLPFRSHWLLKNWQISGTNRLQTGQAFTVITSGEDLTVGESSRPNRIAKGTLPHPSPDAWFDTDAFVLVPTNSFLKGTSGRNILDGPGLIDMNVSLIKRIPLRERYNMQFRVESFNLLNHGNLNLPNNNFNVVAGATITAARNPRMMQFGFKLQF